MSGLSTKAVALMTALCIILPVLANGPASKKKKLPRVFKSREQARDWINRLERTARGGTRSEHLQNLKSEHPRLMLSTSDIVRLKDLTASNKAASLLARKLRRRAIAMLDQPVVKYSRSADGNILKESRAAQKRISTLAGLYLIDGDGRFLERAIEEMMAVAELENWNPSHFLDTAEMTAAMAIGYDWLYSYLSDSQRLRIRQAIVKKGLQPGLEDYASHRWWTYSDFNWNIVCNGGLVTGALAIADEEPEIAGRVIECARISVPYAMSSFKPDGGWAEGPGYWCYSTKYVMFLLASLKSAMQTDFGWMDSPGLSRTGFFRIHYTSPLGKYFNFADSKSKERRAPQMFWMSREFNEPVFARAETATSLRQTTIFHLIYLPERKAESLANLPRAAMFHGTNTGFYRSSWTDPEALYIAFKGGSNQVNHSHLDLGTFILDWHGVRWINDLGPDRYSLPGYFGKKRWQYYRLRTEGHNTVTIDGQNQLQDASASITDFSDTTDRFQAKVDLSSVYGAIISKHVRTFQVDRYNGRDTTAVVSDHLRVLKPVSMTWHLHTTRKVRISADGRKALLRSKSGRRLAIRLKDPKNARFAKSEIRLPKPQLGSPNLIDLQISIPRAEGRISVSVTFEEAL